MNNHDLIQAEAVEKLSTLKAGALFMKMGTGKTKVALDLIISRQGDVEKVLWLAPASLIREASYIAEVRRWSKGLTRPIEFFTIEGLSQSDRQYLKMRSLAGQHLVFCVVDESSTIKNNDAKRTKRLMDLRDLCDFRLILNGTPLSKSLLDLHSQISFIHPKILNMNEAQFAHHFLEYEDTGDQFKPWRRWSKPANEAALVEFIRPYIFDAELDIDAKIEVVTHRFNLSGSEHEEYGDLKQKMIQSGLVKLDFLALSQKLQHYYSSCKDKLRWLGECLNDGEQHLIFVKYYDEIDAIVSILPGSAEYSGRSKADLTEFESGRIRNLICTYGTGAYGLNLQFCKRVIFFTQTFDWKNKEQALHRVYRIGQSEDVVVHDLWVGTGLEGIIEKSLEKKQKTSANVQKFIANNGVQAL